MMPKTMRVLSHLFVLYIPLNNLSLALSFFFLVVVTFFFLLFILIFPSRSWIDPSLGGNSTTKGGKEYNNKKNEKERERDVSKFSSIKYILLFDRTFFLFTNRPTDEWSWYTTTTRRITYLILTLSLLFFWNKIRWEVMEPGWKQPGIVVRVNRNAAKNVLLVIPMKMGYHHPECHFINIGKMANNKVDESGTERKRKDN